ncbi:MAG TPA: adenine deaminase C-terminal domain-containing protein [Bacillota bacterium]|nr:adenine deaminase C-terminal domain-containing protein [Bacillota bacterium]
MNNVASPLSLEKWNQLIEVARFEAPATTWIKAGKIFNVFTGELTSGNIALCGDRIAYVGNKEPMVNDSTHIIEAFDYTLVPGYVDPHTHPFQLYNPLALMEFALSRGTTTLVHDNLYFYLSIGLKQWDQFMKAMSFLPVKNYWWVRLDPQTNSSDLQHLFSEEAIHSLLSAPQVLQAGELTGWKDMLEGISNHRERMYIARQSGKRIEAHNPGASVETLNAMVAAGATCCHESITTEEVLRRLRLGMYVSLRYSSIRPDLPHLLKGILEASQEISIPWNRLLMTTDGSPPFYFAQGFTDELLRIALDAGVPPVEAYRMVTINPAVYYGLERDLGAIAPGRMADILFLEDLQNPLPCRVMANGQFIEKQNPLAKDLTMDWESYDIVSWPKKEWSPHEDWFTIRWENETFPVAKMLNAVILQRKDESLLITDGVIQLTNEQKDYVYVSLIDRDGKWVTNGIVSGFGCIDALASTYTVSRDLIVVGRDPKQMAMAAKRVLDMGGGICLYEANEISYELALPLLGGMSEKSMDELIPLTQQLVDLLRERGYNHQDPIYTLFFLTATHLPLLRWTHEGIVNVKTGEVVITANQMN